MDIAQQRIIPAARSIKDFEWLMSSAFEYVILLDVHISQLVYIQRLARENRKRLLIHTDLIHGLKSDEAAAQFLCQVIKPAGLISTHSSVIATAKKNNLLSIQRIFLLDSHALHTSYNVIQSSSPDYIEVLPGMMANLIQEVADIASRPIVAGGFIRTIEDAELVLSHGATAVTSSSRQVWNDFQKTGPPRLGG